MDGWKKSVFLVWFAETVAIIGFNFVIPFLPYYIQTLGITDFKELSLWSGLLTTAPSLTLIIGLIVWGIIADKIGRKFILFRGLFFGTVIIFLMGVAKNVNQIFYLRLLQGFLTGTVTSSIALISSITPKDKSGFGFGLIQTSIFAGVFLGPTLGGITIEKIGYRESFTISSFLLFIAMILILFVKEEFSPRRKEYKRAKRKILKRDVGNFIFLLGMVQFSSTLPSPVFPLFIQKLVSDTENLTTIAGTIIGFSSLIGSISSLVSHKISEKTGYKKYLFLSLFFTGIFLMLQGLSKKIFSLFIFKVAGSFTSAGLGPVIYTSINQRIDRDDSGKIFGITGSLSKIGSAIGPFTGGFIASISDISVPFLLGGLIFIITGIGRNFICKLKAESDII